MFVLENLEFVLDMDSIECTLMTDVPTDSINQFQLLLSFVLPCRCNNYCCQPQDVEVWKSSHERVV